MFDPETKWAKFLVEYWKEIWTFFDKIKRKFVSFIKADDKANVTVFSVFSVFSNVLSVTDFVTFSVEMIFFLVALDWGEAKTYSNKPVAFKCRFV